MSYKPTQEEIIDYLYGELDESKKAQIDQYIKEHPEFKSELEDLEGTRMLMGQLEDEEVPSPMTFMPAQGNSEWLYWRKYVAIAASFLLLFTFGKISGFSINYGEEGFQAGFGTIEQGLNADEVQEILQADREALISFMMDNIESVQDSLGYEINTIQASFEHRMNAQPETLQISDAVVDKLLDQQKQDLMDQMAELSESLTDNYRDIFKGLYDSFSEDITTQRHDDLRNIQAAFTTLENATKSDQEKIEEALFNLSQEVNALVAQNNNNNNNNNNN